MEREKIMDRTMTGRTDAVKAGKVRAVISNRVRYGFQWENPDTKEKIILNDAEAEVIRWMAETYAVGTGTVIIRQQLQEKGIQSPRGVEWSDYTIMSILGDRRITGKDAQAFLYKEKRYKTHHETIDLPDDTYPAIVTTELFERIQLRMKTNKEQAVRSSKYPTEFLLRAGYVRCAQCKRSMGARYDHRRGTFIYRCNIRDHGSLPSKILDGVIWQKVEEMAEHVTLIEQAISFATQDNLLERNASAIDASIVTWQKVAANYLGDLADATLTGESRTAIRKLMDDANRVVTELRQEKAMVVSGLVDKARERAAYEKILGWCKRVKEARGKMPYQQQRDFLQMLGIVVMVRCEKPYKENSTYDMRVALPALQALISLPGEDGELVTSTPAHKSALLVYR